MVGKHKINIIDEPFVQKSVRKYLLNNGWKLTNLPKSVGEHGKDITAWHSKKRKVLIIEAKGEVKSSKDQQKHNAFINVLGEILFRMDKEGNSPKRARIYAIAIPVTWENTYKKKIVKMEYGWHLLKLKVFLVEKDGSVRLTNYRYWLKS